MARPLAQFRFSSLSRQEAALLSWSKPLLVAALQNVPNLCAAPSRHSKAELGRIVRGALEGTDDQRQAMQSALSAARRAGIN